MTDVRDTVRASKGTVFDDLGYAPEHRLKADIALAIKDRMQALKLTQTAAALRMGIHQPDLSAVLRGAFRGYSVERMAMMLGALDCDIDMVIRPHGTGMKPHIIPVTLSA